MWSFDIPGWGMGMGMWGRRMGRGHDWMLDRVEGRLAFLKTELKITDAQLPAWNQFADAIRSAAKQRDERLKTIFEREDAAKTLPERVEAHEQFMVARLDQIKQIKAAVNNLYSVLSEDQKKEADEVVMPMAGMMGPMMGPMRGWRFDN